MPSTELWIGLALLGLAILLFAIFPAPEDRPDISEAAQLRRLKRRTKA
jgi:hypothetical protein